MADEKGPVHYQISITGGQAGAFFLALLVALCLAFFFGMKTGAAARKAPPAEARLAAASDIQGPRNDKDEAGEGDATTSRPLAEPPLGVPKAAETKEPKEPKEGRDARKPAPEERESRPPAEPPKTGQAEPPNTEQAEPPKATPSARAGNGGSVDTAPPGPTRAPAKEESGPWFVQVAAVQNAAAADGTVKRLKAGGFASDISTVTTSKGELFRVRVGPFPDRAAAEAASQKVQAAERLKEKPIVVPASR